MTLRTKLFLLVGSLLLTISVAVYIIPSYFGKKRVAEVEKEARQWIHQVAATNNAHNTAWLNNAVRGLQAGIDSALYLVSESPYLRGEVTSDDPNRRWTAITAMMSYLNHLDFIQIDHPSGEAEVVAMGVTRLYPVVELTQENGTLWVAASAEGLGPFIGVALSNSLEGYPSSSFLFPPKELLSLTIDLEKLSGLKVLGTNGSAIEMSFERLNEIQIFLRTLEKESGGRGLTELIQEKFLKGKAELSQISGASFFKEGGYQRHSSYAGLAGEWGQPITMLEVNSADVYAWRIVQAAERFDELQILQALGKGLSSGGLGENQQELTLAAGVVKLEEGKKVGAAVLGQDLVSIRPLFNAGGHYMRYPPTEKGLESASQLGLFSNPDLHELSVVNTLQIPSPDGELMCNFTVGTSISFLTWELALHMSSMIFAVYDGSVVSGFSGDGEMVSPAQIAEWQQLISSGPSSGESVEVDGETYYIWTLSPEGGLPVTFYALESNATYQSLIKWITGESQKVIQAASRRLLIVSFSLLVIGLVILEVIARRVTRPLTQLVGATQLVAAGKYSDVKLPHTSEETQDEVSQLSDAFRLMVKGLSDKERIRAVLNKAVSKEIADQILSSEIKFGGEVRDVAVLFADIRNFTGLTERMDPEGVIAMLNEYMSWVSDIIEAHRGVIDKYVGDAVMALYGAPLSLEHAALQAIVTALLVMERLVVWNREREARGKPIIEIGIGIHQGPVVAGNMGGEQRQNYTVLGANVNLSARLCSKARRGEILISGPVYQLPDVLECIEVEDRGAMEFKGFSEPVQTYRVVGFRNREAIESFGIRTDG